MFPFKQGSPETWSPSIKGGEGMASLADSRD